MTRMTEKLNFKFYLILINLNNVTSGYHFGQCSYRSYKLGTLNCYHLVNNSNPSPLPLFPLTFLKTTWERNLHSNFQIWYWAVLCKSSSKESYKVDDVCCSSVAFLTINLLLWYHLPFSNHQALSPVTSPLYFALLIINCSFIMSPRGILNAMYDYWRPTTSLNPKVNAFHSIIWEPPARKPSGNWGNCMLKIRIHGPHPRLSDSKISGKGKKESSRDQQNR